MDSKPYVPLSATEATSSHLSKASSGSSSPSTYPFPIRASPSSDSDTETVIKTNALKTNNKSTGGSSSSSSSISSSSSSSSDDGGYVSGEEEFETASERPFVADPDEEALENAMDEDDNEAPFVEPFEGSSYFLMPGVEMPIAKVSTDDEDDDDVVEGHKARVFGGEEVEEGGGPKVRVLGGGEVGVGEGVLGMEASVVEELGSGSFVSGPVGDGFTEPVGIDTKLIGVEGFVEKPEFGGVVSEERVLVETGSSENPNSTVLVKGGGFGVTQEDSVEVLVDSNGDKVFENPQLNEGVGFADERSSVPENGEVLDGNHSDIVYSMTGAEQAVETVEESEIIGGGTDQVSSVVVEPAEYKLVEADGVNSTAEGGSAVEAIHLNLTGSGVAVVGDMEENKESEIKGVEVLVDGSVKLDNGSYQTGHDAEEPDDSKSVGVDAVEKNVQPVAEYDVETPEPEPLGLKTNVASAGKDETLGTGAVIVDTVVEDNRGGIKMDACADESETLDLGNNELKPKAVTEPGADSEAKQNEPIVKMAADGVEIVSSDKVQDGHGDGIQAVDGIPDQGDGLEDVLSGKSHSPDAAELSSILNPEVKQESEDEANHLPDEEGDIEGSVTDGETEGMIFGSSEAAQQFLEELEQGSGAGSHSGAESSRDHFQRIDGQIVTDSDEEVDTDEEGDGKELFDSAALTALLKAATSAGSDGGGITITSQDGSRLFSVEHPAGLGSSLRSLKPAPRPNRSNLLTPSNLTIGGEAENNLTEEEKKKLEKIHLMRVKFLRLVQRLGHSPDDSIAAQVLYRLALVAGRQTSQSFSLDTAKTTALQLEAEGKDDLDFSLNILVLGKSGVGKSATINSIFGEEKALIDAFEPATTTVKEITGTVDGVKIRIFDTPGLKSSVMEQGFNRKILSSVRKFTKKCPPDIVLYVDRLDTQTRDLNDLPLLRSITSSLGPSIWRSAIVTLTHAASAPPDGPSGSPLSYEVFVAQRSHVVQQSIGQAVGDLRLMNPSLMNPVSLVENHSSCRKNREGQKVLPNGQSWRPQLLMLCYSLKVLSEASSLSKPQDPFDHRKLFGFRVRSPPLPYLLSSLLQPRAHPKLSADQGGEDGDSDIDLADLSDSDHEEDEDEYDQLPPFKPLRKSQITKLSMEQRKAYFEEYDYRVKLLQKKQWREELKRMREIKKKGKDGADDYGYTGEDIDPENETPAAVPVPLPDMALPPSFDCDNPAYRYRFLEPTSQFLARPVLDTHGWDHDCGYDGVNLEQSLAIASRFPAAVAVQITKDKKEFNIHLDSSVSAKHGENGSSLAGFDIQTIGKQLAYVLRGETKFKNLKKNKTAAGVSVTFLGENVATGFKMEDQIALGKRLILVGSTGTVRSQGDAAYGANLEVRLREPDFPIDQNQSTLGLSLIKWRGDLALGANLQSQFSIGRNSKIAVRAGLNNKLSGQITVRTSSSEQLQIALVGILPIAIAIYKSIWPGVSENYSIY